MSQRTADSLVHAWMDALNAGQLERVLALYADDAILLPTFSPHAIRDTQSRRAYFEQLGDRPGFRVTLHEKTLRRQVLAGALEIASGIYRFHVDIDEEPLVFEARFSFVVDCSRAAPILHHHSSQVPRTLS